jgi:hypothetical protein
VSDPAPIFPAGSLAALVAEGRARIAADEAEIEVEQAGIVEQALLLVDRMTPAEHEEFIRRGGVQSRFQRPRCDAKRP